jgi:hypothetical protein
VLVVEQEVICLIYNTGGLKTVALSPSESVVMGNPISFDPNKRYCYEFL